MTVITISSLTVLIFAIALLYASVGNAGATGYLAAMALFGVAPEIMKPTALTLNILVATIATVRFYRDGHFSWTIFLPFAIVSIPFAFLGGSLILPGHFYKPLVGLVLFYAAFSLLRTRQSGDAIANRPMVIGLAVLFGIIIGLLSGLTGIGGGIFLGPLLLFMEWAKPRQAASISAAFILVNSIAGLLGHFTRVTALPTTIPVWAIAALLGGYLGATYGSRYLSNHLAKRILAVILIFAGVRMML
ncbi:MAG: hypothetical protein BWK79_11640 [Beggiatoa sp. IS2]|nr:MAG: hypothetical protein BWK79_11640 [Beggiatoa sp. IS2]